MRTLLAFALALPLVTLAGCDGPPVVTPVPTPTATPVFASDEEALAAAEKAYAEYAALADQILAEGGKDPARLAEVATGDFLSTSIAGFERAQVESLRSVGQTVVVWTTLQAYYPTGGREGVVVIYTCDDISNVQVLDGNGNSVVAPDRPNETTFSVGFDLGPRAQLLISSREAWSNSPC